MTDTPNNDPGKELENEVSFKHFAEEPEETKKRDMVEEMEKADDFND